MLRVSQKQVSWAGHVSIMTRDLGMGLGGILCLQKTLGQISSYKMKLGCITGFQWSLTTPIIEPVKQANIEGGGKLFHEITQDL